MSVVATLMYAPTERSNSAAIGVIVFGHGEPLMQIIGEQPDGTVDWVPFASLFPDEAELAWAFAEWVDWLQVSVREERITLHELQRRITRPTMSALTLTDVHDIAGKPSELLASEFLQRVPVPEVLPPHALGPLFEELAANAIARANPTVSVGPMRPSGRRAAGDLVAQGKSTGIIVVKSARAGVSPKHRAASILRSIPDPRPECLLVVTNLRSVADALRELGVDSIALGEPKYLQRIVAWVQQLA